MAISRASFEKIPVHLVSSVPSIETLNNIQCKKYKITRIAKRFKEYPLPKTKIVNLNINKLKNKLIAEETISLVKDFLKKESRYYFY